MLWDEEPKNLYPELEQKLDSFSGTTRNPLVIQEDRRLESTVYMDQPHVVSWDCPDFRSCLRGRHA